MVPKSYGSVLIHFRNGEITGIQDKIDYNPISFIDSVEKPVSRVVVRNYKKNKDSKPGEKLADLPENGEKVVNLTKKGSQSGSKLAGDE